VPAIILFDGVCLLCNGAVRFILKRDPNGYFNFAVTQGEASRELAQQHHIEASLDETFVLIEGGQVYDRTDAALRIASQLGWPWRAFVVFSILPAGFRNWFYNLVARNRYRWFGRRPSCMVPGDEVRHRFLD